VTLFIRSFISPGRMMSRIANVSFVWQFTNIDRRKTRSASLKNA
jgi:hypothetical protein